MPSYFQGLMFFIQLAKRRFN